MGMDLLISLCIPCHNRAYDLKKVMPHLIDAANASPPVEIVVLDYNSPDDLAQYMRALLQTPTDKGVSICYRKYIGKNYYHMAHARNLSVLMSSGEYICIMSADIYASKEYIPFLRSKLGVDGCVWMYGKHQGLITLKRSEFIDAGGYDERFEFYGPEDKDLNRRLLRRGLKPGWIPEGLLFCNLTSNKEKIKNYRLKLSKSEMTSQMWDVFLENEAKKPLVANPGGWGSWN